MNERIVKSREFMHIYAWPWTYTTWKRNFSLSPKDKWTNAT